MPRQPDSEPRVWIASAAGEAIDEEILSEEERARSGKFRFEMHRRRYLAAHCMLRRILGGSLGVPPRGVRILLTGRGKPYVEHDEVRFNLSHSEDMIAIAVSGREVGIDIERLTGDRDLTGVARRFFAPAEAEAVASASDADRTAVFYRIWTLKEAYAKATGEGLMNTRGFDLSQGLTEPEFDFDGYFFQVRNAPAGFAMAVAFDQANRAAIRDTVPASSSLPIGT